MKKLIIHIGYPKTASTSLQDGLFAGLHNQGLIKYFGKTEDRANEMFKYARRLSRGLFFNPGFKSLEIKLSKEVVNVISEENLTFLSFFNEIEWEREVADSYYFAEKIAGLFAGKADDIKIMATLRNQQTLIYSQLVEEYPKIINKNFDRHKVFDLIFKNMNQINIDIFKIYNFSDVLKQYARFFGKNNIKILLFEDYVYNRDMFMQELSKILGIDFLTVKALLTDVHHNVKRKSKSAYYTKVEKKALESRLFGQILDQGFVKIILQKTYTIRKKYDALNRFFADKLKNMKRKKRVRTIGLAKFTEAQNKIIFNEFRDSNKKLITEFGVNADKLRYYGYI